MGPTEYTILGLAAWTVLLVSCLAVLRTALVMAGKRAPNSFSPTGEDVSPFSVRLIRAHANCYENLPFVIAILLLAVAMDRTELTDYLAYTFLAARIGQSAIHIVSTSNMAVRARFFLFLVQIVIFAIWVYRLVTAGI